ncbi:hypothetical protein ACX80J_15930 [Arthrobacter sp. MDB2-24]
MLVTLPRLFLAFEDIQECAVEGTSSGCRALPDSWIVQHDIGLY